MPFLFFFITVFLMIWRHLWQSSVELLACCASRESGRAEVLLTFRVVHVFYLHKRVSCTCCLCLHSYKMLFDDVHEVRDHLSRKGHHDILLFG